MLLPVAIFVMMGCTKTPHASFTIQQVPDTWPNSLVNLINTSTDADHYQWDLGNGTESTETSPMSAYSSGTYTISLTAYSKDSKKSDVATQSITVAPRNGTASFGQSNPSGNVIDVHIGGKTYSQAFINPIVNCDVGDDLNIEIPGGTYNYTAAEESPGTKTWSGTVVIPENGCIIEDWIR